MERRKFEIRKSSTRSLRVKRQRGRRDPQLEISEVGHHTRIRQSVPSSIRQLKLKSSRRSSGSDVPGVTFDDQALQFEDRLDVRREVGESKVVEIVNRFSRDDEPGRGSIDAEGEDGLLREVGEESGGRGFVAGRRKDRTSERTLAKSWRFY